MLFLNRTLVHSINKFEAIVSITNTKQIINYSLVFTKNTERAMMNYNSNKHIQNIKPFFLFFYSDFPSKRNLRTTDNIIVQIHLPPAMTFDSKTSL